MNWRQLIIGNFFVLFLFFSLSGWIILPSVYAQLEEEDIAAGLESCFIYYDYGKVHANLATQKPEYKQGETAKIVGIIENANTFPITDVILYAHVKRVNENEESFADNGHYLVERLKLVEGLNFLPGEKKWVEADIPILPQYPDGSYQVQYFLFSTRGYHYAGRPFVEEDVAGRSLFTIQGGGAPQLYFDINGVSVNGVVHTIREVISEYPNDVLSFQIPIIDTRQNKSPVSIQVSYFSFEDVFESNQVSTQNVVLQPGQENITSVFTPPSPGAYVLVAKMLEPVGSQLKFRFVKQAGRSTRLMIADLGVTEYPATESGRAYTCFHSPMRQSTPPMDVTLALLDDKKQVIDQKKVSRAFTGDIKALSLPLDKLANKKDFWVRVTYGTSMDEAHYSCNTFRASPVKIDGVFRPETRTLDIVGQSVCGETINGPSFVESIKVVKDGNVMAEQYNIASLPHQAIFSNLEPGSYVAQVQSGKISGSFEVNVPEESTTADKKQSFLWWIILIFLSACSIGGYLWWKRRKKKLHKEQQL